MDDMNVRLDVLQGTDEIRLAHQILRLRPSNAMHLHKNRIYVLDTRKNYSGKSRDTQRTLEVDSNRPRSCPSKPPCSTKKEKKESFWQGLFGAKKKEPLEQYCKQFKQVERKKDPDLREFGGQAFRTCGPAYIVQKSRAPEPVVKTSEENRQVKKIEAHPDVKDRIDDPMPQFKSVEQRMMDLDRRRLHPLYKKYRGMPNKKPMMNAHGGKNVYKTRSGPIGVNDIPAQLRINKDLLERKNMYAEYKRVEPPKQLINKMLEMKENERPTLERRLPNLCNNKPKRKAVFDTLHQNPSLVDEHWGKDLHKK